jgi:transposase
VPGRQVAAAELPGRRGGARSSLGLRARATVGYATRIALRELGRRAQFLGGQLDSPGELILPLLTAHAPGLLALYGVGPDTAALLLIAAGDHPERLRSEAAWAHLCAAAPIPASSGKTVHVDGPWQAEFRFTGE